MRPLIVCAMGLARLYQKFVSDKVAAGPFQGMRYGAGTVCGALAPKLLGTYELELAPLIERAIRATHDLIVDVGAAEGYYAVGFARRLPGTRIVVFESDGRARDLLRANAGRNSVADRIEILGACDCAALETVLREAKNPFVLMDAEGAEMELLDPLAVPALKNATVLVELHDFVHRRCGEIVREQCAATHQIQEIPQRARTRENLPAGLLRMLSYFSKHDGVQWLDEWRPESMRWFFMKPKAAAQAAAGAPASR